MELSGSQINRLKSATKKVTDVILRSSKYIIGKNETNFLHNLQIILRLM